MHLSSDLPLRDKLWSILEFLSILSNHLARIRPLRIKLRLRPRRKTIVLPRRRKVPRPGEKCLDEFWIGGNNEKTQWTTFKYLREEACWTSLTPDSRTLRSSRSQTPTAGSGWVNSKKTNQLHLRLTECQLGPRKTAPSPIESKFQNFSSSSKIQSS